MKVIRISEALRELESINAEIRHISCIEGERFTVGLVSFQPNEQQDGKQIVHDDKDVVCQVLEGRGQLRVGDQVTELESGVLCHIPNGTPHDFRAAAGQSLVLCYSLITTQS
jgi:quercetin dioxygenase-like cupin family protein